METDTIHISYRWSQAEKENYFDQLIGEQGTTDSVHVKYWRWIVGAHGHDSRHKHKRSNYRSRKKPSCVETYKEEIKEHVKLTLM